MRFKKLRNNWKQKAIWKIGERNLRRTLEGTNHSNLWSSGATQSQLSMAIHWHCLKGTRMEVTRGPFTGWWGFETFACILKNIICNMKSRDWAICINSLPEVIFFMFRFVKKIRQEKNVANFTNKYDYQTKKSETLQRDNSIGQI